MVKPSLRREMAHKAVAAARCSIRQACEVFSVSESCYRYRAKLSSENAEIADLLVRLTHNQRNWGFGLCFLYLRNVKGYPLSMAIYFDPPLANKIDPPFIV